MRTPEIDGAVPNANARRIFVARSLSLSVVVIVAATGTPLGSRVAERRRASSTLLPDDSVALGGHLRFLSLSLSTRVSQPPRVRQNRAQAQQQSSRRAPSSLPKPRHKSVLWLLRSVCNTRNNNNNKSTKKTSQIFLPLHVFTYEFSVKWIKQ